jgi:hypothetical protein
MFPRGIRDSNTRLLGENFFLHRCGDRPGPSTFTRIFLPFSSFSHVRAKERNAALLAAYTPKPGKPFTEATEPVIMIDPPSLNSGNAFWTVNSVPRAFRPKPHRSAIDSDSIRDFLLEPAAAAAIVLLRDISDARSISRLLRSGVRAILSRESETDDVLSAFYAAAAVRGSEVWLLADDGLAGSCCSAAFGLCSDAASPCDAAR